jgi:hypothetical protein
MPENVSRHEFQMLMDNVKQVREDTTTILEMVKYQNSRVYKLEKEQAVCQEGKKIISELEGRRKNDIDRAIRNTQLLFAIGCAIVVLITFYINNA